MNIAPWKKRNGELASRPDAEDFWKSMIEPFDWPFRARLPEIFQGGRVFPPMNVAESEGHYTVTLELPGMDPKDVSIEIMGNQLQVSGERKWEEEKEGREFHRMESQYGRFERSLALPDNLRLDRSAIAATYEKGVLTIRIPKLQPTPAARIPIQTK
jgi:HSP20 family protein